MKTVTGLSALLTALMLSACSLYSEEDNRPMEYSALDVTFSAILPGESLPELDGLVGVQAFCTRGGKENVQMTGPDVALYKPDLAGGYYNLYRSAEDQAVVAEKGDHNFRFYAYYPYSESVKDFTAIPFSIPSLVKWETGSRPDVIMFAAGKATSVVAPVGLAFESMAVSMTVRIPDYVFGAGKEDVKVKSLEFYPADQSAFEGNLAYDAEYNLLEGRLSETLANASKSVALDFGSGMKLSPGYTDVTFLTAPFSVPKGGFEIMLKGEGGISKAVKVWRGADYAGTEYPGGTDVVYTINFDRAPSCISPVKWPIGWVGGELVASRKTYAQAWGSNAKDGGKVAYSTRSSHTWNATQALASIEFIAKDPIDGGLPFMEWGEFSQFNYAAGCVKGLWTGDCFELRIPMADVAEGTQVHLELPVYGRGHPIFWNLEYLDGEEWKYCGTYDEKSSPDGKFKYACTHVIPYGDSASQRFVGTCIDETFVLANAIEEGSLKIRLTCATGEYKAPGNNQNANPVYENSSARNESCVFSFVRINHDQEAITVSWE